MIEESTREDATLFALDLLQGEEREHFAQRLAVEPELALLVRELRDCSAEMVLTLPTAQPRAELRDRVLAAARSEGAGEAPAPGAGTLQVLPGGTGRRPPLVLMALAACLLLTCLDLALRVMELQRSNAELRDRVSSSALEWSRLQEQYLEAQAQLGQAQDEVDLMRLRVAELRAQDQQEGLASVIWDTAAKKGVIHIRQLAANHEHTHYQLWAIGEGDAPPVDAGVFTVGPQGEAVHTFQPTAEVGEVRTFAISLEENPRHSTRRGPIILAGSM